MPRNSADDPISDLIALGVIIVIGYGIFRVVRAFAGRHVGDRVTQRDLLEAVEDDDAHAYCPACDEVTELCQRQRHERDIDDNRCMDCNGGVGNSRERWCDNCQRRWYDEYNDD